jgi:hypothetical protein
MVDYPSTNLNSSLLLGVTFEDIFGGDLSDVPEAEDE